MHAPAPRVIRAASDAGSSGRRRTETSSEDPGRETHVRPSRPRPCSWWLVASTVQAGAPSSANRSTSVFVDPVTSANCTGASIPAFRAARATVCSDSMQANLPVSRVT